MVTSSDVDVATLVTSANNLGLTGKTAMMSIKNSNKQKIKETWKKWPVENKLQWNQWESESSEHRIAQKNNTQGQ